MIDVLNWLSAHFWGIVLFLTILFCMIEELITAARRR